MPQRIPNLGLRMVEATLPRRPRLPGVAGAGLGPGTPQGLTVEALADEVAAFDPDVVGCSGLFVVVSVLSCRLLNC